MLAHVFAKMQTALTEMPYDKIHSLYKNKENLTLKKILVCDITQFDRFLSCGVESHSRGWNFSGGRTSLGRLLINMGFTYKTINNQRSESVIALVMHIINGSHDRAYYEKPRIVHQRHIYLRKKAWVEEDTTTKGTIGGIQGYVLILYSVFVKCF